MIDIGDDDDVLDENGLLRDKKSLRVPMMMRDADLTPLQLAVRDHARKDDRRRQQQRIHDGSGDAYGLHRPGYRFSDQFDDAEAIRAYDQMKFEQANAWRRGPQHAYEREKHDAGPPAGAYGPMEPHRIDQPCTIDGQPGTLQPTADNKWLICKPSLRADSMSVADAEAIKQQAYDEMCQRMCNAWRHPGSA
jgi:hypothetical protein